MEHLQVLICCMTTLHLQLPPYRDITLRVTSPPCYRQGRSLVVVDSANPTLLMRASHPTTFHNCIVLSTEATTNNRALSSPTKRRMSQTRTESGTTEERY